MDLEQVTDRRAPKKMGSRAMKSRLPYASAVPSGVATNFAAVAFTTSVALGSEPFMASRTEASVVGTTDPWSTSAIFTEDWVGQELQQKTDAYLLPSKATFAKAAGGRVFVVGSAVRSEEMR